MIMFSAFAIKPVTAAGVFQPEFVVENDQLITIKNIELFDTWYDVTFKDGQFNTIFGEQGELLDFTTDIAAAEASNALLLAFNTHSDTRFTEMPNATTGCDGIEWCFLYTPWAVNGNLVQAYTYRNNEHPGDPDLVGPSSGIGTTADTSVAARVVWADWEISPAHATVPAPPAAWLFLSGLAALGLGSRKHHSRQQLVV